MAHNAPKKKVIFSDIKNNLSLSSTGTLALVEDSESVKQSILTILTTKFGERVMLPTFGSILHEYLFEPIDYITEIQIKSAILSSLQLWEDRISVTGVAVEAEEDNNSYIIEIRYIIILTKTVGTFIGRISAATE